MSAEDTKEKNEDEGRKASLWERIRDAVQSPPGRFIAALLGAFAVGSVAYRAGRRERFRGAYRHDRGANSGGSAAERYLWDSLIAKLERAGDIAGDIYGDGDCGD